MLPFKAHTFPGQNLYSFDVHGSPLPRFETNVGYLKLHTVLLLPHEVPLSLAAYASILKMLSLYSRQLIFMESSRSALL